MEEHGAETIGNEVVLSKLYYKNRRGGSRDGFTAFEFHLTMDLQPRVAICVLHRTDYRHCVRDLRKYFYEGYFPGGNQANLQMVQPLAPIYPDSCAAGFMTGPHVAYTNNLSSNGERNILGANQADQMAVQHAGQYLAHNIAGFMNGSQLAYTTAVPNSEMNMPSRTYPMNDGMHYLPCETNMLAGEHSHADETSIQNYYYNPYGEF